MLSTSGQSKRHAHCHLAPFRVAKAKARLERRCVNLAHCAMPTPVPLARVRPRMTTNQKGIRWHKVCLCGSVLLHLVLANGLWSIYLVLVQSLKADTDFYVRVFHAYAFNLARLAAHPFPSPKKETLEACQPPCSKGCALTPHTIPQPPSRWRTRPRVPPSRLPQPRGAPQQARCTMQCIPCPEGARSAACITG